LIRFSFQTLHDLRNRMFGLSASGGVERIYGVELIKGRPLFDVAIHYAGTLCVLEGERARHSQMQARSASLACDTVGVHVVITMTGSRSSSR
jgi:hypothetical protein